MSALHPALKAACAVLHGEVDDLFSRFDLGDARDYGRFLQAHAAAVLPLEQALDQAGMAQQLFDWPARQRAAGLRRDLEALQIGLPPLVEPPPLYSPAQLWGAAYVLEGSRLGGAVLARRLPPGFSAHYLRAETRAPSWSGFLSALEAALGEQDAPALIASAQATFAIFKRAAQHQLEVSAA